MEFITYEEVMSINKNITSCYIENPININQDIIVEIYYEYINLSGNLKNNGIKTFKSATITDLIAKIKEFFSPITDEEVLNIHDDITYCIIENPNEIDDKYYVKIFFKYLRANGEENTDGRHEFISESREDLLKEIKDFITNFKTTY
jgi:hypothetical protein